MISFRRGLTAFFLLWCHEAVRAAVTTVTVTTEPQLISNLNSDTSIRLGSNIFLTSTINIQNGQTGLTIDGLGKFKVDGQDEVPCFLIQGALAVVTLTNLQITGGSTQGSGGGISVYSAQLTVINCAIQSNSAYISGGGLCIFNAATVVVESSTISANKVGGFDGGSGAGVCLFSGYLEIVSSVVSQNIAKGGVTYGNGGGLYIGPQSGSTSDLVVTITSTSFTGNTARNGGGIRQRAGTLSLIACKFKSNTQGDVYADASTATFVVLSNCAGGFYDAGEGELDCTYGCPAKYPANLLADGTGVHGCQQCPEGEENSCCGAYVLSQCKEDQPTTCTPTELDICPDPTLAPTTTLPPTVTIVPSIEPTPSPSAQPSYSISPTTTFVPTSAPTAACGTGEFFDKTSNSCLECIPGIYSNITTPPWPSSCSECQSGKIQPDFGQSSCSPCDQGTFANAQHTICSTCEPGEYSDGQQCISCQSGRYAPQPLTGKCLSCATGSHTNAYLKATQCNPCPPGSYTDEPGPNCTKCFVGTASPGGQDSCHECFAGFYANDIGLSTCLPCQSLALTSRAGSAECDLSSKDYYLDPRTENISSLPCPGGAACEGGIELPRPLESYWVDRSSLASAGQVHRCFRKTCTGTGSNPINTTCWEKDYYFGSFNNSCDSNELQCRNGAEGPLCGSCANGFTYSSTNQRCVSCRGAEIVSNVVVALTLLILIIPVTALYGGFVALPVCIKSSRFFAAVSQLDSGTFRIIISTYQIVQVRREACSSGSFLSVLQYAVIGF